MMQAHAVHSGTRALAYVLAAFSAGAMFYVGLYQSRAVQHLWCPVFGKGCEAVADAPFARPFGIPDGYIAGALYSIVLILLLSAVEKSGVWIPLVILVGLAALANALGVRDMAQLGHYCFYCVRPLPPRPSCYGRSGGCAETMGSNGRLILTLWGVAVLCTPRGFALQHPPNVKVEKKAMYVPAGKGQKPFEVTHHSIPVKDIQSGGPPKDGIPALDHPLFTSVAEGDKVLRQSDVVLGLEFDGIAKAYPLRILNWHEVVNDDVGNQPVLVSWCPLCGSGVVYNPIWGRQRHTFGVSGLLYKRNLLLYDRETESLWSQLGGSAVTGDLAGTFLQLLPVTQTTWARWESEHPRTVVLSFNTGFRRDYSKDPYGDWQMDRRLAAVVEIEQNTKLYPFSELKKAGASLTDVIGGMKITVLFDRHTQTVVVRGQNGEQIPHFVAFLADARAFYPNAPIFKRR